MVRASQVFIPGGQPTFTYNPRAELRLEDRLAEYLDDPHKLLSVSGPTKSGKTVLVRTLLPEDKSVWISGGTVGQVPILL